MKRIFNGKAFNTDTAQAVARGEFTYNRHDEEWISEKTLYRTKGGAFFSFEIDTPLSNDDERQVVKFDVLTYDKAHSFARGAENLAVEILVDGIFPSLPEADDEQARLRGAA